MVDWWGAVGESSLLSGGALGALWALFSTHRRRIKFLRAGVPPVGQLRWFLVTLVSMSSYLTLVTALGLASFHDIIPRALFLFLLLMSALAFVAALMLPSTETGRSGMTDQKSRDPSVDPPLLPLRKSA